MTANLRLVTAAEMRELDRATIEACHATGEALMERAGAGVAEAMERRYGPALALRVIVLAGTGNNGGDGFVAARHLARAGADVIVAFVATESRPKAPDAGRNWDRLQGEARVQRIHAPVARDVAILGQGIEKASVVVDALLGTGVSGVLRDPIRTAVEVVNRARAVMVPVLAVDTPTAVDLSSGQPSDPAVRADLTITFHRPKTGLRTKFGAALAAAAVAVPACSISRSPGTPRACALRSAPIIASAVIAGRAAVDAQRSRRPRRSSSNSVGSSAGSGGSWSDVESTAAARVEGAVMAGQAYPDAAPVATGRRARSASPSARSMRQSAARSASATSTAGRWC